MSEKRETCRPSNHRQRRIIMQKTAEIRNEKRKDIRNQDDERMNTQTNLPAAPCFLRWEGCKRWGTSLTVIHGTKEGRGPYRKKNRLPEEAKAQNREKGGPNQKNQTGETTKDESNSRRLLS